MYQALVCMHPSNIKVIPSLSNILWTTLKLIIIILLMTPQPASLPWHIRCVREVCYSFPPDIISPIFYHNSKGLISISLYLIYLSFHVGFGGHCHGNRLCCRDALHCVCPEDRKEQRGLVGQQGQGHARSTKVYLAAEGWEHLDIDENDWHRIMNTQIVH